jgi:hypothetical protein
VWADEPTTGSSCDEMSANQCTDGGLEESSNRKRRRIRSSQHTVVGSLPKHFQQSTDPHSNSLATTNAVSRSSVLISQPSLEASYSNTDSKTLRNFASAAAKPVDPHAQQLAKQQFRFKQNQKQNIIGRSRGLDKKGSVSAARPYFSKATFCVDNVSTDVTELVLSKFVAAMDIDVLGCYQVNPRRTYFQRVHDIYPNTSTFRVCIPLEDSKRFLDPKEWPAHVSVSWWTFKKKESNPANSAINLVNGRQISSRESSFNEHRKVALLVA